MGIEPTVTPTPRVCVTDTLYPDSGYKRIFILDIILVRGKGVCMPRTNSQDIVIIIEKVSR